MSSRKEPRKEPVDMEEIIRNRTRAALAASKPRFIPRAERERLKKQREEDEQRQREEEEQRRREQPKTVNRRPRSVEPPTGPQADRKRTRAEIEAAEIRARYLPEVNQHSKFSASKKRRRATENKFKFDWDPSEDTSRDYAESLPPDSHSMIHSGMLEADILARAEQEARVYKKYENGEARASAHMEKIRRAIEYNNRRGTLGKHWSAKKLDEMRERDWRIFKEDFGISIKGAMNVLPMRNWGESGLPSYLLDIVSQVGYADPTPVQRAAIPIALTARDLISVAVTGSGKTAAYLLPLLAYIYELPPLTEITKNDGPYALIIAPTRELVQQIETEAKKFAGPLGFTVVSLVGGHALEAQSYALRNGAEIIVATPGRLVDCIERRLLVLSQCCYIIMDEADRMIDMGFEEPVNKILDNLPVTNKKPDSDDAENPQKMSMSLGGRERYRQTMMYTATMPAGVERIATQYLRKPAIVTIGNSGEAVDTVEQRVEFVAGEDRRKKRLREILTSRDFAPPIIVFVNIKRNCDAVAREIKDMGLSAVTLHGSKTQEQREQALASVRRGETQVLVATDLAGRGIDVPDVSLVVNFNMAGSIESYTHRIGRTGRAGKSGVAVTFVDDADAGVLYDLRQLLAKSPASRVPEELRRHEAAQNKPTRTR
ncbi:Pre-mRNA-splicing ATP-dependent RNA helicase PRP28 [Xylariaceae sp. FL0804]|nr:Pre-mRNA-splicing ATP-dependent RNA helicase PRP28 [Xylariaceae sp. FL0804]